MPSLECGHGRGEEQLDRVLALFWIGQVAQPERWFELISTQIGMGQRYLASMRPIDRSRPR